MLRRPRGEQVDSAGSGFRCSRQQKPMKSSGHKGEGRSPTNQSLCTISQGQDSDPLEKEPEWPKWSSAPLPGGELHARTVFMHVDPSSLHRQAGRTLLLFLTSPLRAQSCETTKPRAYGHTAGRQNPRRRKQTRWPLTLSPRQSALRNH